MYKIKVFENEEETIAKEPVLTSGYALVALTPDGQDVNIYGKFDVKVLMPYLMKYAMKKWGNV
jgi:hypothetical protein